ncbi:MAG: MFS transporter [Burkholderiaceae bacterium]
MNRNQAHTRQTWLILGGTAVMLSLAMGMRQSFGLFQPHMVREIGITAADFSFAVALQNIVWGATQPFVGMLADRHGSRPVMIAGVLVYLAGLVLSLLASSAWVVTLGIGVCVGIALSCTGSNIAMTVTSRAVSPARRSVAMGSVSAAGSLGLVLASPLAQSLIGGGGWKLAMIAFVAMAVAMLPAALLAGRVDAVDVEHAPGATQSVGEAVREAAGHPGYVVMALAFFVCGLQLVFLTTHLPTYLEICGMDPTVGSTALALIGLFNVAGSYLFGWLGGRYSRRALLGGIYLLRSAFITAYFVVPPSPASTLVFAAAMGTLWLGVVPLVNGLVVHLFGLRFMATLAGIAFLSHQVGSFVGAWGGGLIYGAIGSYDLAWKASVAIGVVAGLAQMTMNTRPTERVIAERTAGTLSAAPAGR